MINLTVLATIQVYYSQYILYMKRKMYNLDVQDIGDNLKVNENFILLPHWKIWISSANNK